MAATMGRGVMRAQCGGSPGGGRRHGVVSLTHARQTREAFLLAASVLQQMQEARFPGMTEQTRRVMDAAKGHKADADLLDRTPQVRQFFTSAATALRGMAPTS